MFPDYWGSDYDYQEAHGNGHQPRRRFTAPHIDTPLAGETGRELSADELTRAVFSALAKVSAKTKGAV